MSTLRVGTISNAAGSQSTSAENVINGSAKAWVNFNGTGTVAIRASYNVTSITDNGTGDYTVNFTTAMPDANYCADVSCGQTSGAGYARLGSVGGLYSTTQLQVQTINTTGTIIDTAAVCASIFR